MNPITFGLFFKERSICMCLVVQGITVIYRPPLLLIDLTFELAMKDSSNQQQGKYLSFTTLTKPAPTS